MKRTLHLLALPHTTLTEKDITCAYSMKVLKFVTMMQRQGFYVILYGPDELDPRCKPDEHVIITTAADRIRWGFGNDGFDTAVTPFLWTVDQPYWFETNQRVIDALRERVQQRDYLCLIAGWCQEPVARAVSGATYKNPAIAVEWGVGYEGVFTEFCAWESYAWMHHVYGLQKIINGRAYDQVIPNFFDPDDFEIEFDKEDYVLFIGRVIQRKGPHVAAEIAKRVGMKLKIAGPGVTEWSDTKIVGQQVEVVGPDLEYVGQVGFKERAELMAKARAVIVPTLYIEPFGGVAVEAMLSGTPVLASDWGSFTEIVDPYVGRRFRTPRQAVKAFEETQELDPSSIRKLAEERFSLNAVGPKFKAWFDQLDTLWGDGWYA